MRLYFIYFFICLLLSKASFAQNNFKFALITDTHVGSSTGADDLKQVVKDINANPELKFVIHAGDITEFGTDEELTLAKSILDKLNKPYHIVSGNHDVNWSESGGNSVLTTFGSQTFSFQYGGFLFLGTASGPFMRMGPGQIPREDIVWLDSVLVHMDDLSMPIIFINHYPLDEGLNNWYEAIDFLKTRNIQLALCGHGHTNKRYLYEGIPGVMSRSILRAGKPTGGYNIVTINNNTAFFQERITGVKTLSAWTKVALQQHHFMEDASVYDRPSYAVNKEYAEVNEVWQYHNNSDMGSGIDVNKKYIFGTNTNGYLYALDKEAGRTKWRFQTGGKIYSTPAVSGKYVVVASSDHYIYGIKAKTGKLVWKYKTHKPVVASPLIHEGTVFIGASDGHFRALDLKTGKLKWAFEGVTGFVVSKPVFYKDKIYFGCWGNNFYCLDAQTGKQIWKWNSGASNRMYSPAVCQPIAVNNRIFIVAPDRYMTALNAENGSIVWRKKHKTKRVRESMGVSEDSTLIYVKTMEGEVYGVSTLADSMKISWRSDAELGYEICPTPIIEENGFVFVPTQSGLICALNRATGKVIWQHKVSNCLVSSITPLDNNRVVVSTMDGRVTCLAY